MGPFQFHFTTANCFWSKELRKLMQTRAPNQKKKKEITAYSVSAFFVKFLPCEMGDELLKVPDTASTVGQVRKV